MYSAAVLLVSPEKKRSSRRRFVAALRSSGSYVVATDNVEAAQRAIEARLIHAVVLLDMPDADRDQVLAASRSIPTVCVYRRIDRESLLDDPQHPFLSRIYSPGNPVRLARRVAIAVESLLRNKPLGIEDHLPHFGVEYTTFELCTSDHRDAMLKCIDEHLEWLGARSLIRRGILDATNELARSALKSTPLYSDAKQPSAGAQSSHNIRVRFGSDGETFAFSIRDPGGSVTWKRLANRISDCLQPVVPGVGTTSLSTFLLLKSAEVLTINVVPGRQTEVVALFSLRERRSQDLELSWTVSPETSRNHKIRGGEYHRILLESMFSARRPPRIPQAPQVGTTGTGVHQIDSATGRLADRRSIRSQSQDAAGPNAIPEFVPSEKSVLILREPLDTAAPQVGELPRALCEACDDFAEDTFVESHTRPGREN
jgi:hypothetical protein